MPVSKNAHEPDVIRGRVLEAGSRVLTKLLKPVQKVAVFIGWCDGELTLPIERTDIPSTLGLEDGTAEPLADSIAVMCCFPKKIKHLDLAGFVFKGTWEGDRGKPLLELLCHAGLMAIGDAIQFEIFGDMLNSNNPGRKENVSSSRIVRDGYLHIPVLAVQLLALEAKAAPRHILCPDNMLPIVSAVDTCSDS